MRATIADIARAAGVSTATVDRVLNDRSGVRARTRDSVRAAAARLGYADPPAPAAGPVSALEVLLPGGTNSFMSVLAARLDEAAALRATEVALTVRRIEGFVPEVLAAELQAARGRAEGVAVIALDHPLVREAIRELVAAGVPVLTLVSDIAQVPRCAYVGIDNRAAGRLAGHLLGRFMGKGRGQVAMFAGSLSYRGHEEREAGFRHALAEDFPELEIVELREVRDDLQRSLQEARGLLAAYRGLGGIYNIGAGNRGIAAALEESGRAREVVFIGHELTEHTRRFLLGGTMDAVIDQNPREEAAAAVERLLAAVRGSQPARLRPIRIEAIFRENIPEA
ncbi:MAG: LacI family DNA-binding transcriptional regulator [Geminicoccaceae bacterium]